MGIQIYLLDRRRVTLRVADRLHEIGTLRRFWKGSEINRDREAEITTAAAELADMSAPVAAMVAEIAEIPLAGQADEPVSGHIVLGWDADRVSVTDFDWDFLPVLGYAVKTGSVYTLYEHAENGLIPFTRARAVECGILTVSGHFNRMGQPQIIDCRSVQHFMSTYCRADCILSDGRTVEIITAVRTDSLPASNWYLGKRPFEVTTYPDY